MSIAHQIAQIPDCEYFPDRDLSALTTFKLSARADFIEIKSVDALRKIVPLLLRENKKYLVLGWGANQILPAFTDKIILRLSFPFDLKSLEELKDEYVLPASLGINHLTGHAVKFGLKGWEVFTGIPASLGGAIYMNAGTNLGEIGNIVKDVTLVTPSGELRTEAIGPESFSYRHNHFVRSGEIIVGATLVNKGLDPELPQKIKDYLEYRKATQPLTTKNCGCVFKNPRKELQAGRLIDLLGLKGLSYGGLRVSPKHANFMENTQNANWDHFEALVETIKLEMNHFYGIEFELEVKIPYD
jgi:UDP-N-acetylmuramate dehydrogenase